MGEIEASNDNAIREDGRASKNPQAKDFPAKGDKDRDAEERLEEGLEESFPGSDPLAITDPGKPGRPDKG
ncbi:MAG: hypothetical protein INR68_14760 [Methylobacterium mesophilicum]|nr:hypothetical protein [Methylobacterium mesophilicum]